MRQPRRSHSGRAWTRGTSPISFSALHGAASTKETLRPSATSAASLAGRSRKRSNPTTAYHGRREQFSHILSGNCGGESATSRRRHAGSNQSERRSRIRKASSGSSTPPISSASIRGSGSASSARSEQSVSSITKSGQYVAEVVELAIERGTVDLDVGVSLAQPSHAFGRRYQTEKTNACGSCPL